MTKSVILIGLVLLVTFIQITELRGIRGSRGRSYRRPRPRPTYERARQNAYSGVHVDPPSPKKDLYDLQRHNNLQRPNDDYHVARPTVMKFEYRPTPLPSVHATTSSRHADEMESLRRRILALSTMRYARANRTADPDAYAAERRHRQRIYTSWRQRWTEASRVTEKKIGAASRTNKSSVFFIRAESPVNETEPSLKNGLKMDESAPRFDDDSRRTDPVTVTEANLGLDTGLPWRRRWESLKLDLYSLLAPYSDDDNPENEDDSFPPTVRAPSYPTTGRTSEKCSRLYIQDPPCRAATKNWYYDSSLKRCIRGICGFRDNLFTTKRECLERCM